MSRWLIVIVLAFVTLGLSAGWQHWSAPAIASAEQQLKARTWLSVLPAGNYDNQPLQTPLDLQSRPQPNSTVLAAYLATLQGRPSAVVLHSRVQGYQGPIDLLIAIDPQGRVIASRVLQQHETPGLGARIAQAGEGWLDRFIGRSTLNTPDAGWALKRDNGDFDQIAGASITSRAVIHGVQDALRHFDQQAAAWLPEARPNE